MKTVIIFGGTGYVGQAVIYRYLKEHYRVILLSRLTSDTEVIKKLASHGLSEKSLYKYCGNRLLKIIPMIAFDRDWDEVERAIFNIAPPYEITGVINLIAVTGTSQYKSVTEAQQIADIIVRLITLIRSKNDNAYLCNIGSTSELSPDKKNVPYESAKLASRNALRSFCNLYIVVGYVIGAGNSRLKADAPRLWRLLRISRKWLFGFKVSYVSTDVLADTIFNFLDGKHSYLILHKRITLFLTSGEKTFGDIVGTFISSDSPKPDPLLYGWVETVFLIISSRIIPIFCMNNQYLRRISSFARRSSIRSKPNYLTLNNIRQLAFAKGFKVIQEHPRMIVSNCQETTLYVIAG